MSAIVQPPKFLSESEELKYWKNVAHEKLEELKRVQKDNDEFMFESRMLEKEYEATIDQNEEKIKELRRTNTRTQNEIDALRVKMDISYIENSKQQTEIDSLKSEKQQLVKRIIDLEKYNDDLERSRRIIEESMAGFEQALNSALEKNAILENEVDEKERLKENLQRLADEARDLKQELLVKDKEHNAPNNERILNGYKSSSIDKLKLKECETQTSPAKRDYQQPLPPAAKVMAVNIVSDLIRKVGSLERRLQQREIQNTDLRRRSSRTSSSTLNGYQHNTTDSY